MKFSRIALVLCGITAMLSIVGCTETEPKSKPKVKSESATADMPTFSLATSEYPSWSTYMVAQKAGLIGKDGGAPGLLEKKWGVRIKLEVKDYDQCLTMFGSNTVDAVCMTNMDSLNPALGRPCTAIMPTSTSNGADKIIGVGLSVDDLKTQKTYGLKKSVSEYVFIRGAEKKGLDWRELKFENLDPAAAATALQTGSKDIKAICVWNPFALQALRSNKEAKVLWDSTIIPEEIIDMVVIGNDSLKKEGGEKFAYLLCDIFYNVSARMNDEKSADVTFKALGEDFSNLSIDDMKICCRETSFYATPQDGIKLFSNQNFQNNIIPKVIQTCHQIAVLQNTAPSIGWNDSSKQLNFETKFMQKIVDSK